MKAGRSIRLGVFICLGVAFLVVLHLSQVKAGLLQLEQAAARQLAGGFMPLLTKAHQNQDDLSITELLNALSKAPGVQSARVLEGGAKIIRDPPRYAFALKGRDRTWGNLELCISAHTRKKMVQKQLLVSLILYGLLGGALYGYLERSDIHRSRWEGKRTELEAQRAKETRLREAAEGLARQASLRTSAVLRDVVALIEKPVILLDERQRVAAMSRPALELMRQASLESMLNKSWLEAPLLGECGKAIEDALRDPRSTQSVPVMPGGLTLRLRAIGDDWVEIRIE